MLHIIIPDSFLAERLYTLRVIFEICLGLDYQVEALAGQKNTILQAGGKSFLFEDAFAKPAKDKIPKEVHFLPAKDYGMEDIPILFGKNDIFASAFFMLSRWEELYLPKDCHYRPEESEMFVVKHYLYKRPLVDEYALYLSRIFAKAGIEMPLSKSQYSLCMTTDVDHLFRFDPLSFLKLVGRDISHYKSVRLSLNNTIEYIRFILGKRKDPFDSFDILMDLAEEVGVRASFYFRVFQDPRAKLIMKKIAQKGHIVGIHPSPEVYDAPQEFLDELNILTDDTYALNGGRMHYLAYDIQKTFDIWENAGLAYDAGLGFTMRNGFRCGICRPYPMFDIQNRKERKIWQHPLIAMETVSYKHGYTNPETFFKEWKELIDTVRKYQGEFVCLWHNNSFFTYETAHLSQAYKHCIHYAK